MSMNFDEDTSVLRLRFAPSEQPSSGVNDELPKSLPDRLDPAEGARLIRAFVAVRNESVRAAIVSFVENLAKATRAG